MEQHNSMDISLFGAIQLDSNLKWIIALIIISVTAITERILSLFLDRFEFSKSFQTKEYFIKMFLFGLTTLIRYLLMLAVMNYSFILIATTVISLTFGQTISEILKNRWRTSNRVDDSDSVLPLNESLYK